jgi:hypothetical protein
MELGSMRHGSNFKYRRSRFFLSILDTTYRQRQNRIQEPSEAYRRPLARRASVARTRGAGRGGAQRPVHGSHARGSPPILRADDVCSAPRSDPQWASDYDFVTRCDFASAPKASTETPVNLSSRPAISSSLGRVCIQYEALKVCIQSPNAEYALSCGAGPPSRRCP